jgi:hypothetical protein
MPPQRVIGVVVGEDRGDDVGELGEPLPVRQDRCDDGLREMDAARRADGGGRAPKGAARAVPQPQLPLRLVAGGGDAAVGVGLAGRCEGALEALRRSRHHDRAGGLDQPEPVVIRDHVAGGTLGSSPGPDGAGRHGVGGGGHRALLGVVRALVWRG